VQESLVRLAYSFLHLSPPPIFRLVIVTDREQASRQERKQGTPEQLLMIDASAKVTGYMAWDSGSAKLCSDSVHEN
jgi:hypothetical protein